MNNFIQTIISSIVGLILVNIFQHLIDFRGELENIFREEEKKMKKNKDYKINKQNKLKIIDKITKLTKILKIKITIFIFFEFLLMLFFYYFVTAFCEVYNKTQISWLYDFFISFIISFFAEIIFAFMIAIMYFSSKGCKMKIIYKITLFLYNL